MSNRVNTAISRYGARVSNDGTLACFTKHHGVTPDEQETSCVVEVTCGSREPIAAADVRRSRN